MSSTVGGQASPRNSGKSVERRHALRNVWRHTHCGTHSAWGGATGWIFFAGAIFAAADRLLCFQTTKLSIGMGLPFNVNGNRRQMPWQVC